MADRFRLTIAQLNLQALGVAIESQYLSMTPYLVTIVVLVIISACFSLCCLSTAFSGSPTQRRLQYLQQTKPMAVFFLLG